MSKNKEHIDIDNIFKESFKNKESIKTPNIFNSIQKTRVQRRRKKIVKIGLLIFSTLMVIGVILLLTRSNTNQDKIDQSNTTKRSKDIEKPESTSVNEVILTENPKTDSVDLLNTSNKPNSIETVTTSKTVVDTISSDKVSPEQLIDTSSTVQSMNSTNEPDNKKLNKSNNVIDETETLSLEEQLILEAKRKSQGKDSSLFHPKK